MVTAAAAATLVAAGARKRLLGIGGNAVYLAHGRIAAMLADQRLFLRIDVGQLVLGDALAPVQGRRDSLLPRHRHRALGNFYFPALAHGNLLLGLHVTVMHPFRQLLQQ